MSHQVTWTVFTALSRYVCDVMLCCSWAVIRGLGVIEPCSQIPKSSWPIYGIITSVVFTVGTRVCVYIADIAFFLMSMGARP